MALAKWGKTELQLLIDGEWVQWDGPDWGAWFIERDEGRRP